MLKRTTPEADPSNTLATATAGTSKDRPAQKQPLEQKDKPFTKVAEATSPGLVAAHTVTHAEASKLTYASPYDTACPLDYIILDNRSKNANNFAIRKLKEAWPKLKIIQVVQEGRDPIPGADEVVQIKDWNSMDQVKAEIDKLARKIPALRKSKATGKVGFYSVWSAQAEDPEWGRAAQKAGFKWIGASPDKMMGLDKTDFKTLAQEHKLPTAAFVKIPVPKDVTEKQAVMDKMAADVLRLWKTTPDLGAVFLKHNKGGGGRGTVKLDGRMSIEAAMQKIINETGGDPEGVYIEQALDLEGAQLFQLELEGDSTSLAQGGRLVWFNKENQKVLEVGFSDEQIEKRIPKEIYQQCRAAAQKIFEASGYDNRGTCEILISRSKDDQWSFNLLELNKRIQVENEALSELVADSKGRKRNVPAEQVMRSCGFPPPKESDFHFSGPGIVVHKRLLSCEITEKGSVYPSGLDIHGAMHPQGADVQYAKGPVHLDADPQIGRELFTAGSWEEMCDKLLRSSQEFQFFGPGTETSTYNDFFRKLASNPEFRAGRLGCNQTFDVLKDAPVEAGLPQKVLLDLATTVTPLVTHGYRYDPEKRVLEGVKDQPFPTPSQIQEFLDFMEQLRTETPPETPFSRFLEHHDYQRYVKELKEVLTLHGGGSVTVFPRDVMQSMGDQESALLQQAAALIAEIYFAGTGMGVGYETGGAQYQAALMRKFDWLAVLLSGCLSNLPSHSLTRSKWMNGLSAKTPEEQAFVFKTIAEEVAKVHGWSPDEAPYVPWAPYNFHAGNDPEQDITTREMLRAGLQAIPCWAFDPRYTEEQFRGWVQRQIALFKAEGKPFNFIRIKNAGEGKHWNSKVIVKMVEIMRGEFKKSGLEEPIIYIHNHEHTGAAATTGKKALQKCQKLGYNFLVVDSAPPGLSHNSNLVISSALKLSPAEKRKLELYNRGSQLLLNLASRFNFQNLMRTEGVQDPYSDMAGGTGSSDLADAIKMKIPPSEISKLLAMARELTGLGTPVTPYSEWIKQIGFAIWNNKAIEPKTVEAATAYIQKGGQLTVAPAILQGLREWKTLLPRPPIVAKLLSNHGINPEFKEDKAQARPVDVEAKRAELQAKLPRTRVGTREIATALAFDKIGEESMIHRDRVLPVAERTVPRDMTPMMANPAFVHRKDKLVGHSFTLYGKKVTIDRIAPGAPGKIEVDYLYEGQRIRTVGVDPVQATGVTVVQVPTVKDPSHEIGAIMPGNLERILVSVGERVKKGQVVAIETAMKMEHAIRAPEDGTITWIRPLDDKNKIVEGNEVVVRFDPLKLDAAPTVPLVAASLKL